MLIPRLGLREDALMAFGWPFNDGKGWFATHRPVVVSDFSLLRLTARNDTLSICSQAMNNGKQK